MARGHRNKFSARRQLRFVGRPKGEKMVHQDGDSGQVVGCRREEIQPPKLHPLLVEVVVRQLLKQFPISEWSTLREVCRTWWYVSQPIWRNLQRITLMKWRMRQEGFGTEAFLQFWNTYCIGNPFQELSISYFTLLPFDVVGFLDSPRICRRHIWQPAGAVVTRLILDNCNCNVVEGILPVIVNDFPVLAYLTITDCKFSSDLEYAADDDLRYDEIPAFPHHSLKSLKMSSYCWGYYGLWRSVGLSYFEIFTNFPNIKTLNLNSLRMGTETVNILQNIARVREIHRDSLPIEVLKSDYYIPFADGEADEEYERPEWDPDTYHKLLPLLQSLDIRLEKIHIPFSMSLLTVPEIIRHNSRRLRALILDPRNPSENHVPLIFSGNVHLDFLEELWIGGNVCSSLRFVCQMKNLEQLVVVPVTDIDNELSNPNLMNGITNLNVKLENLHELEIYFRFSVIELQVLGRWFPNIRHLTIPLDDEQFSVACQNWAKLVSLEVIGNGLTDFGVLGFRGRNRQNLVSHISTLTSLNEFAAAEASLGKPSVKYGFIHMKSLTLLGCPSLSKVSPTLLAKLHENSVKLMYKFHTALYYTGGVRTFEHLWY